MHAGPPIASKVKRQGFNFPTSIPAGYLIHGIRDGGLHRCCLGEDPASGPRASSEHVHRMWHLVGVVTKLHSSGGCLWKWGHARGRPSPSENGILQPGRVHLTSGCGTACDAMHRRRPGSWPPVRARRFEGVMPRMRQGGWEQLANVYCRVRHPGIVVTR
ncbi:hypothetical protein BD779DRAFT_1522811 [Infundibulicybe gibba]|nr:hypothetical protein BD779DRAFT_1522811 [Infundibulicybe gibba]